MTNHRLLQLQNSQQSLRSVRSAESLLKQQKEEEESEQKKQESGAEAVVVMRNKKRDSRIDVHQSKNSCSRPPSMELADQVAPLEVVQRATGVTLRSPNKSHSR